MRALREVGESFFDQAPVQLRPHAAIEASIGRVFDALADAEGWPSWFPMMTEARYTSAQTRCLGSERVVSLRGLGRFQERFFCWEPPQNGRARFSFFVTHASSPLVRAVAEDYVLIERGPERTHFSWTMAIDPVGPAKPLELLVSPLLARLTRQAAGNLSARLKG